MDTRTIFSLHYSTDLKKNQILRGNFYKIKPRAVFSTNTKIV